MGWIFFGCFIFYGLIMNAIILGREDAKEELEKAIAKGDTQAIPDLQRHYNINDKTFSIFLGIGIAALAIFILFCIGCVWYFFCGGFLVFEDQPFLDKVLCGLISLMPLGIFLGLVAIFGGWNPPA